MIKTIKIDADAFERLAEARRGAESLSEVIKRCVPRRRTIEEISRIFSELPVSDGFLAAVDESATRRRKRRARRS